MKPSVKTKHVTMKGNKYSNIEGKVGKEGFMSDRFGNKIYPTEVFNQLNSEKEVDAA